MREKLPVILMVLFVAAVALLAYYALSERGEGETTGGGNVSFESAERSYDDPQEWFKVNPPPDWKPISTNDLVKATSNLVPEKMRQMVKFTQGKIKVVFMDVSNPSQAGSNMNVVVVETGIPLVMSDDFFSLLKNQIRSQYSLFGAQNVVVRDSRRIDLAERKCAYFEISYSIIGLDLSNIQVIVPGKSALSTLTYTITSKEISKELKQEIEKSYRSYVPNSSKGL